MRSIKLKRAYIAPSSEDGQRILVDRLWPRGVSKETAKIDLWLREIAPSTDLRKWFAHLPERWEAFQSRYTEELKQTGQAEALATLANMANDGTITLVFAAKDEIRNNAVVLKALLEDETP